jgi:hypothetical protein
MIQALLAGRKTMTRRLAWKSARVTHVAMISPGEFTTAMARDASPWQRVKPGDRLWVREGLALGATSNAWKYRADDTLISMTWPDHRVAQMVAWAHHQERETIPSIHMPRIFSRLTLVVTATKIERLQDISAIDAIAEGLVRVPLEDRLDVEYEWQPYPCGTSYPDPVEAFAMLWQAVHDAEAWRSNPEVVALSFEVHKQNIDSMKEAA